MAKVVRLGIIAVALYYAIWGGEYSMPDLWTLYQRQAAASRELELTSQAVDSLAALAERLESDDRTIETVARERFGLIRDGEIIYRFIEVEPEPATPSLNEPEGLDDERDQR